MDKWLSHPTALKIISVILGLLLWAVVHIDPETSPQTVTSNIDTKIIEAATIVHTGLDEKKYVLTAMEPTVARIVVEGRISSLLAASNADYVVEVDLSNVRAGIQELPLTVKMPRGIKEVELSPRRVTVQIEEIVHKTFDAQVLTEGNPAAGYVLGTPEIVSDSGNVVQVTLPKDDMDKVGIVAVKLNVEGADKTLVNKKAKIVVYDKEGQEITNAVTDPATLHVEAKVTLPFKQVPIQVRYTGNLPDHLSLVSVTPKMDQVTVYAQQTDLDAVTVYDGAVLDLSKVEKSGTVLVKAGPVDGIHAVDPGEIELEVVVEAATKRKLTGVPVTVTGTAAGMTAKVVTPTTGLMDLEISGAESVLSEVKLSDVAIIAKADGLAPGTHTIAVELDLPAYVQPVIADGQSLSVTIQITDDSIPTSGEGESEEPGTGGNPTEPPENSENASPGGTSGGEGSGNATEASSGNSGNSLALTDRNGGARTNAIRVWGIDSATI
ncbi:YbbR-like domain-containing protein [Paenibacillus sp. GCM10027627]|uniref:CdaR family protein n=1 Tax=unclassified Paenibacillus TaxID=185978 RepID=UPI0036258FAA